MLLKKMQLRFVTHFSFDFILSAVESYKLHVRSPVGFGRQWRTFISRHFFWILKKEMKVPHWISCILEQHCIWPGFLPLENVCDLLLQHFEKEMLLIFFFQEYHIVEFYIYGAFLVKSLFWKQQQHVSIFLTLLHLLLLAMVENPELLNLCTDIGTNCSAVKSNMLLYPFLSFY